MVFTPTKDKTEKDANAQVRRCTGARHANGHPIYTDEEFKALTTEMDDQLSGLPVTGFGRVVFAPLFDPVYVEPLESTHRPSSNLGKKKTGRTHMDESSSSLSHPIEMVHEGTATSSDRASTSRMQTASDASTVRKSGQADNDTNEKPSPDEIMVQNTMAAQFGVWKSKQRVGKELVDPPIDNGNTPLSVMVDLAVRAVSLGDIMERTDKVESTENDEHPQSRIQLIEQALQDLLDAYQTDFKEDVDADQCNQKYHASSKSNLKTNDDNPKLAAFLTTLESDAETEIEIVPATFEDNNASGDASIYVANDSNSYANSSKQQYADLTQQLKAAIIKAETDGKDAKTTKMSLENLENLEKLTTKLVFRFSGNVSEERAARAQIGPDSPILGEVDNGNEEMLLDTTHADPPPPTDADLEVFENMTLKEVEELVQQDMSDNSEK